MDAVTPNRYTPVPVNVRPDVPHYVNLALLEIGRDMALQILRLGAVMENAENADAEYTGRLRDLEQVAPAYVLTAYDQDYFSASHDMNGNVVEAVNWDGVRVLPQAVVAGVLHETHPDARWIKGGADTEGNLTEDVLDANGQTPLAVLKAQAERLAAAGGTGTSTAGVDILIVAGQSNATERSALPVSVADADPRILKWNKATGKADTVSAAAVDWVGSGFAREYVKSVPGRRLLIVPTANGSTGFTTTTINPAPAGYYFSTAEAGKGTWDRHLTADPVNHYRQMIDAAKAAKEWAGDGARLVGMIWSQGESDRGRLTQGAYAEKLDDLITQARAELDAPNLPVLIGSMTPETVWDNSGGTAAINAALLDTPRRVQRTAYVWGPPDMVEHLNSRVHWSPQGQAQRGAVMAGDGLYRARLNVAAAKPVQPQRLSISRSGTEALVQWDAPPCRVTAYALELSTDAGRTWTAQTLAGPIITEYNAQVPATGTVWARARTTNEVGTSDWTREAKA